MEEVASRKTSCLKVDRDWLNKLLQKHHHGPRQAPIPALALAPMVDQSDLPFRELTRRYGSNICFTPMIHAKMFTTSRKYRTNFDLSSSPETDRPLVAQLCGSDSETMLKAAMAVAPYCDAVDINCGCPQGIARRGMYGAFLLEEQSLLLGLVRHLAKHLPVPLTVKVRLLPGDDREDSVRKSLSLYRELVDAGAHGLTIHGRTRNHKGPLTGKADWDAIRQVVEQLGSRVPIIANGSLGCHKDILTCLKETGADGVMSSEAILEYPAFFNGAEEYIMTDGTPTNPVARVSRVTLAREYLTLAKKYPPALGGQGTVLKCLRAHVHKMLYADLHDNVSLRTAVIESKSQDDLLKAVDKVEAFQNGCSRAVETESSAWYYRYQSKETANVSHPTAEELYTGMYVEEGAFEGRCTLFDGKEDGDY